MSSRPPDLPGPPGPEPRDVPSAPDRVRTEQVLDELRRAIMRADTFRSQLATHLGFSTVEMQALTQLTAWGSIGQSDLARRLGLSAAATTGLVDRLSQAGVVRRDAHPDDRRRSMVTLTDAGHRVFEASQDLFLRALDGFGADELDRFEDGLRRVADNFGRLDDDLAGHPELFGTDDTTPPATAPDPGAAAAPDPASDRAADRAAEA